MVITQNIYFHFTFTVHISQMYSVQSYYIYVMFILRIRFVVRVKGKRALYVMFIRKNCGMCVIYARENKNWHPGSGYRTT